MSKVFLSHSSLDKGFVEPIANLLGKTNCVYDKYTFELGMKTMEEIFDSMESSDIFVYFISEQALESNWVKTELNRAQDLLTSSTGKLTQIYPLIIDSSIVHTDERIAPFLREKYNLQRVDNHTLAYRKIMQQISKLEYYRNTLTAKTRDTFYGRDAETMRFKQKIDDISSVKSAVISGIPGIGKKSFIQHALIHTKIIKPYYHPIILSMPKNGSIEDLIVSLSDAGFGSYSLMDIIKLSDMNEKIDILTDLINKVQQYRELVIIEDDETIISLNGEIKYWFYNAIKNSENGIGVILTSSVNIEKTNTRHYPEIFFENLTELSPSDRLGLLRTYSESLDLDLSRNDRLYFNDCLTGYPPQILYCVDLIQDLGIDYAKDNTAKIAAMPEQISSMILDRCQEVATQECLEGVLSVIAHMEMAPVKLINQICTLDTEYRKAINVLKKYSVCYIVGANGEYVKMNSFIQNFVTRNKMQIPEDIQHLLEEKLNDFNNDIDRNEDLNKWDTSELKFYIKTNLKRNITTFSPFLYSTIILQTISELYHDRKYRKVIDLIHLTKESDRFKYFDHTIVASLQRYLCQALVKVHDKDFVTEVEYFADEKLWNDYHFLKGFWYRCLDKHGQAEIALKKVLEFNPNHYAAKRELVIVYLSLQDYDSALILARNNYSRRKDNLFHLQAYFECLLELDTLSFAEEAQLQEMRTSLIRIHKVSPTPIYYQLLGKYEAFHEKDIDTGIEWINTGLTKYPEHMYLIRDKFDIYRKAGNIRGMEEALAQLADAVKEYEYKGVLHIRQAILDIYKGKSPTSVKLFLHDARVPERIIENVLRKSRILQ